MIKFVCQHCGRWAWVDDDAAGRERRCLLCSGIVAIPLESRFASSNGATPAFAYATGDSSHAPNRMGLAAAGSEDSSQEDVNLDEMRCGSMDETDIMPAVPGGQGDKHRQSSLWQRALDRCMTEKHLREEKARSRRLLITAFIAVIVLLALAGVLALIAQRFMAN